MFRRLGNTAALGIAALILCALLASACGNVLPRNFEQLPLDRQVEAYELHLQKYGHPLSYATAAIAEHGWSAAELAADRLKRGDQRLPVHEALEIIHLVQTGGCPLKGTASESAVREFGAKHPVSSTDGQFARVTLTTIEHNYTDPLWQVEACRDPRKRRGVKGR
jgi:hypothetical protein